MRTRSRAHASALLGRSATGTAPLRQGSSVRFGSAHPRPSAPPGPKSFYDCAAECGIETQVPLCPSATTIDSGRTAVSCPNMEPEAGSEATMAARHGLTGAPAADKTAKGHASRPHTADVCIEAWAPTAEECYEEAVAAFVDIFADVTGASGGI